jgi:DNA modification methylase
VDAVRSPYWSQENVILHHGDAREVLTEMTTGSVHCIVTSPPYYGLRDYGAPNQVGQEPTPLDYIEALRATFTEARRVLADDGTCWLNLGDCYTANSDGWARGSNYNQRQPAVRPKSRLLLPPKNLLGMPWRVAFALQADGWILRNAVIWHKPNAMPQSATDRLTTRYELIFLLVKQRHYWFDLDPIREPYTGDRSLTRRAHRGGNKPNTIQTSWPPSGKYASGAGALGGRKLGSAMLPTGRRHTAAHECGRNPGDVWSISTRPLREAHFAAFPIDIPLRCIAASRRPDGTVLDPFAGAGTTGIAARKLGRKFIGVDIVPEFCELTKKRLLAAAAENRSPGGPG